MRIEIVQGHPAGSDAIVNASNSSLLAAWTGDRRGSPLPYRAADWGGGRHHGSEVSAD